MYDYTVSRSDLSPGPVLPMFRSDMEELGLPEELREILLGYITPLNKAIAVLLQQ
jgi:hypothetical protein